MGALPVPAGRTPDRDGPLRRPGPPAPAPAPQAVEHLVERGQVERYPTDARQAIVSQAKSEGAVRAVHDPRVAGEAEVEKGGADHAEGTAPPGGREVKESLSRTGRLLDKLCEHAVYLPSTDSLSQGLLAPPAPSRPPRSFA